MSLAAAASAMGLPEVLVQRSAEARAADTGASVEEILVAWAGGESVAAAAPAAEAEVPADVEETALVVESVEPLTAVVASPAPESPSVTTRAPMPTEVTSAEASHLPEVVTVPTAGLKERTNFVIPKWLTAVMLIVPLFALFALGGASTGVCGEATELATNVVTGEIVNCDGSEFTGSDVGGGGTDYITLGGDIYSGTAVSGVNCAGCHGANGQGAGSFPALTGALTTFGSCSDHIEWVSDGSGAFTEQGTYGDTNKPVQGGMPSFSGSLSAEQIAAVSAFERVRFGGEDPEAALVACGLVDDPSGDEGGTNDGTTGTDESNTEGGGDGGTEDSTDASAIHLG
jgi:hypothetical protein